MSETFVKTFKFYDCYTDELFYFSDSETNWLKIESSINNENSIYAPILPPFDEIVIIEDIVLEDIDTELIQGRISLT